MSQSAAVKNSAQQFVTLGIDREVFAVEVDVVREILDFRPLTKVPNTPPFVLGILDVRGRGVPVIELRAKLGLPSAEVTRQTRIVVLEIPSDGKPLLLGLLTDRVFEVTPLGEHGLEPPPEIGVRWHSDYIRGIGRRGEDFVIILDLAHLFGSNDIALIRGEA
ncbi:MAG: chemotaxis protein CheW [Magnetospirillum sp.]|nr:chemotaxis protein CheW [Magnetospirillum sp.]